LKPLDANPNNVEGKAENFQHHEAYSIGFYLKNSFNNELTGYRSYRQEEEGQETPAQWFVRQLEELTPEIQRIVSTNEDMKFTPENKLSFERAKRCHICRKPFAPGEVRVRDHCHFTSM